MKPQGLGDSDWGVGRGRKKVIPGRKAGLDIIPVANMDT